MTLPIRNSRIKLSAGQLFWREVGQGTTIIFLHGSWTDSSQWLPAIEQLSSQFHCIAPDLLGFGESERPRGHCSIELQTECLAEFLDTLRLKQVYLVGHSVGSWVAASYALKHAEQVKGLVLLNAEGVQVKRLANRWRWARWLMGRPPVLAWGLTLMLPIARLLGLRSKLQDLLQLRQILRRSPTACSLLFQRRAAEIRAESLQDRLAWLKLPLLLLQSEQDSSVAAVLQRAYSEAPEAKLQDLPGDAADVLQADPTAVAEAISQFVFQHE